MRFSMIMPVRNEAAGIQQALASLQSQRGAELEIILIDGGSSDATVELAQPLVDQVLKSLPGRAKQMNTGAAVARGDWLIFLHADTRLPSNFTHIIPQQVSDWGRFDVRLEPTSPLLQLVAWMMNQRSRLTGICTGDQALVIRRDLFEQIGGYADIPLMEDIELSKRLRQICHPARLRPALTTSSRRWQQNGSLRTIALMWWLRLAFWLGVSPQRLARWYR
ncbi:TIGR04283 family arsenosugar biosynthesis glycosyltransferase [Halopseudomonas salegens]|uniref:Transferase 2, rSAM/selenodomain-associated n=1 Tax=Halopseudomonas salegens TaxID=1434072 RepID=A0A1H2FSY6_9GAMM|nr:TIGR04283 family arsenosugar biosynthesis glycosyltransferase [Halopseudomonas salegens]SDU10444.1 transferase 2, rSAM/selenodomain-associated [Halopseudomonas salegens]